MGQSIAEAVGRLDPANDEHWTTDGLPRVDAVSKLVGRDVVRREITDAAPQATRDLARPEVPEAPAASGEAPAVAPGGDPLDRLDVGIVSARGDDVLELPREKILGSLELVERALLEIDRRAMVLARRRQQIVAGLEALSAQTTVLEAAKIQLERAAKKPNTAVRDYLARQREVREERVKRARKFIESGTTAKDVAEQLAGRSKLDQVMAQRRPGMGGRRPTYPRSEP